jgi:hypothetical protein
MQQSKQQAKQAVPKGAPQQPPKISQETIARISREVLLMPMSERDQAAVAELLGSLGTEMGPLHVANAGESEPAFLYDAGETET